MKRFAHVRVKAKILEIFGNLFSLFVENLTSRRNATGPAGDVMMASARKVMKASDK